MKHVMRLTFVVVIPMFMGSVAAHGAEPAIAASQPSSDPIVLDSHAKITIVQRTQSPLADSIAQKLAGFLELRIGVRPRIIQSEPDEPLSGVVFLLAQASDPAVHTLTSSSTPGLPNMESYRDDGYAIRTVTRADATHVICAGKSDTGIKYAVYRLMRATSTKNRVLTLPRLQLEANPFFRGRYATPSSAMAGGAPPLIQKHYAWENWDLSRIPALAESFDAAGMNGLFLFDSPCRYDWTGNHTPPDEMALKIRTLAQRARDLGMSVCLWVHGASNLQTKRFSDLQPRDPEQLKQILMDFDRLADRYADLVDAIYGHWVDPGGAPPPADITDPQKLQMELVARFERKAGRKMENIFSAHGLHWPMGPGGTLPWAGYKGAETLIESKILPKGTSIATPEMRISPGEVEFARKMRAAGYTCGVFGWLVAEYEMNPGIHVHTHIMDGYFHHIPSESRDLFDWYEEGLVYTTQNPATYYVFSQMLWDPASSADQHLADFCQAAFGPELGPRMLKGYRAVAEVRCGAGSAEDRGMCRLGRGSSDAAKDLKTCEEALAEMDGAVADLSYLPTIPLTVSTDSMISDLRSQIAGMVTYARFRLESGAVGAVIASGGTEQQIREAIARLPKMETWPGSPQPKTPGSWGQPEYFPYSDTVNRWQRQLQEMSGGGAPAVKGPVLFTDDFTHYPEGADGRPSWQPFSDAPDTQPRPQWMTQRGTMSVDIPGAAGQIARATGVLLAGDADWNKYDAWRNYSVSLRLRLVRAAENGSIGLRVRLVGGNVPHSQSGYAVRLTSEGLTFGWLSGGEFKSIQSAPLSLEPGSWHTVRMDCREYIYNVYFDGRLLMGSDDWYGPRKGRVALEVRNAQGAFDDVVIRQID